MYTALLTSIAVILFFILPGYSLTRVFKLPSSRPIETLFYSLSLSVTVVPILGLLLNATIGLNTMSVLVGFLVVGSWGLISVLRRFYILLGSGIDSLRRMVQLFRNSSRLVIGVLAAGLLTLLNWVSAIGTHSIDMGAHVFWAKTIIDTARIPDYAIVEPLDQAVKFTYGSHLMLAQFFLVAPIPIENYSWIPSVIGSIGLWIGVLLLAFQLTGSKWAAILSATLFGTAYHPGGYIQRGNLPDIIGYLLLASIFYAVLRLKNEDNFSYPLGLTSVSVIPYHQLATVILPTTVMIGLGLSYFHSRTEVTRTLRRVLLQRARVLFWSGLALLAAVFASTVTYVSANALSQLATSGWKPFVVPLYEDLLVPGTFLGILGTAGLILGVRFKKLGITLVLSWVFALVFLANALVVGIPIPDPQRFLWRLTEPLSIAAALTFLEIGRRIPRNYTSISSFLKTVNTGRVRLPFALMLLSIIFLSVHVSTVASLSPRYYRAETFYFDDIIIGKWLRENAPATSVTLNNADRDETATWVQVYSMRPHFIYKLDYVTVVAPANYVQIYIDAQILYESPGSSATLQIIQRYNVSYAVAHEEEITLFEASPYFRPVLEVGRSALFETNRS